MRARWLVLTVVSVFGAAVVAWILISWLLTLLWNATLAPLFQWPSLALPSLLVLSVILKVLDDGGSRLGRLVIEHVRSQRASMESV